MLSVLQFVKQPPGVTERSCERQPMKSSRAASPCGTGQLTRPVPSARPLDTQMHCGIQSEQVRSEQSCPHLHVSSVSPAG